MSVLSIKGAPVQVISVAVANGETSKAIAVADGFVERPTADTNFVVLCEPNYAANAWISGKAATGFTVNFTDPTAGKVIKCIVINNYPIQ